MSTVRTDLRERPGGYHHPDGRKLRCYDALWAAKNGELISTLPDGTRILTVGVLVLAPDVDQRDKVSHPEYGLLCHVWEGNGAVQSEVVVGPGATVVTGAANGLASVAVLGKLTPDGAGWRKDAAGFLVEDVDVTLWGQVHQFERFTA